MQLSSLSSIISAVLGAFNSEASSSNSDFQIALGGFPDNFLTFYQNSGTAELCESTAPGYRTFTFYSTPVTTYAAIPNDNNHYLNAESIVQPGAYLVTIGDVSPGVLSFDNPASNSKVIPYINGEYFEFFYDPDTPINHGHFKCYQLWVANNTAYSYGWTYTELYYS